MGRNVRPYPVELRVRAVRMVAELRPSYPAPWATIVAVAAKLAIGTAETLRGWVRQAQRSTRAGGRGLAPTRLRSWRGCGGSLVGV